MTETNETKNTLFYLVLGGLAGFVLALGVTGYHGQHHNKGMKGDYGHKKEMNTAVDANNAAPEHMSMAGMTAALEGKTGDEFDKAFLALMIEHHEGAVDMAEAVLKNAKHDELKVLAKDIISAQTKEIEQMRSWMKAWGYQESDAMMMEMKH